MNSRNVDAQSKADRVQSTSGLDTAAWQKRLDRLSAILATIADHAGNQACWRCPYKDRHDQCTASFGCLNQRRQKDSPRFRCAGDDKLDYRSAWEISDEPQNTSQEGKADEQQSHKRRCAGGSS